jgi:hypothetical protein
VSNAIILELISAVKIIRATAVLKIVIAETKAIGQSR